MLTGKKGVIYGIRSPRSIGWTIAQFAHKHGAELCLSYRGEREQRRAEQLSEELGGAMIAPCDVTCDQEIAALYDKLGQEWDSLDFIVHSVAFARTEDMEAGMVGTTREGFSLMNEISAHSLIAVTRPAVPLMVNGGSIVSMTYMASERVVPSYGPMGAAKAALECITMYLASELGPKGIRCNCLSPGPISTPAARGIPQFTNLLRGVENCAPLHRNVTLEEVANAAVFLLSDMSSAITGEILHVDCGMHVA
ncbi:MAG: enoyl-ACP reductase [Armatimonadetes bacterium]|nr:enoyl-ACP reductase [Armatimonadota bacterium]